MSRKWMVLLTISLLWFTGCRGTPTVERTAWSTPPPLGKRMVEGTQSFLESDFLSCIVYPAAVIGYMFGKR